MEIKTDFIFGIDSIISGLALLFSIYAIYKSSSSSKNSIFKSINTAIDVRRDNLSTIGREINPLISRSKTTGLSAEEKELLQSYSKFINEANEGFLNSYEDACYNYFKNQINKEDFVSLYKKDVLDLVENQKFKRYFIPEYSNYNYILKFYKKFKK